MPLSNNAYLQFHEGIPEGCRIQNYKPGGKHHPFTQHQQHLPVSTAIQHVPDALQHRPHHRFAPPSVPAVSHRRVDPFREEVTRPEPRSHLMQSHIDSRPLEHGPHSHHQRPLNHRHEQLMKHHQQLRPRFQHGEGSEHHRRGPSCE